VGGRRRTLLLEKEALAADEINFLNSVGKEGDSHGSERLEGERVAGDTGDKESVEARV